MQYLLSDNITDIEVNWYRSMREDTAGMDGERVTGMTYRQNPRTNSNITTELFMLAIQNFNATIDTGYYWCQLVVNNVPLSPSPYGYIYSSDFTLLDYKYDTTDQPLCAQNSTVMHARSSKENCTSENTTISPATTDIGYANTISVITQVDEVSTITVSTSIITPAATGTCNFKESGYPCAIGIVAGILLLIVTLILVLSILVLLYKNKSGEHKSNLMLSLLWQIVHYLFTGTKRKPLGSGVNGNASLELNEHSQGQHIVNPHYYQVNLAEKSQKHDSDSEDNVPSSPLQNHLSVEEIGLGDEECPNPNYGGKISLPAVESVRISKEDSSASLTRTDVNNVSVKNDPLITERDNAAAYCIHSQGTLKDMMKKEKEEKDEKEIGHKTCKIHGVETCAEGQSVPMYAVVNQAKKMSTSKDRKDDRPTTRAESVQKVSIQEEVFITEPSDEDHIYSEVDERSPSPEYAVVMKDKKKKKPPKKSSGAKEKGTTSETGLAMEYDEPAGVDQDSKETTNADEELHYYHSLDDLKDSTGACKGTAGATDVNYSSPHAHHLVLESTSTTLKHKDFATVREVSIEDNYEDPQQVGGVKMSDVATQRVSEPQYDRPATKSTWLTSREVDVKQQHYYHSLEDDAKCSVGCEQTCEKVNIGDYSIPHALLNHPVPHNATTSTKLKKNARVKSRGEKVGNKHKSPKDISLTNERKLAKEFEELEPMYAEPVIVDGNSDKATSQGITGKEQHYYHSLEDDANCSVGGEETNERVNTSDYSTPSAPLNHSATSTEQKKKGEVKSRGTKVGNKHTGQKDATLTNKRKLAEEELEPMYDEPVIVGANSEKATSQEVNGKQQHYYHSLEDPVSHYSECEEMPIVKSGSKRYTCDLQAVVDPPTVPEFNELALYGEDGAQNGTALLCSD